MAQRFSECAVALKRCAEALDNLVGEQAEITRERKRLMFELRTSNSAAGAQQLKEEINDDMQEALAIQKALAQLETSKKNAATFLEKVVADAQKDLQKAVRDSNDATNAKIKLQNICKDLSSGIETVRQKAQFPITDLSYLVKQFQNDRLSRDTRAASEINRLAEEITETLRIMSNNLQSVTEALDDFGR